MKHLQISDDLTLPATAVTETFALLAIRGAGKTNAARVMAEEMHAIGAPFVAIDPVGSWFGLRSGRDGKRGGGIPIPIFGGRHGDVPLERGGGVLVADLVVDSRLSCVLDLSAFESEAAKKGFLLDFARRLYLRNTEPLHLFLEEADDYVPQKPMHDELQLVRAWENIIRRGRSRGLGMTLITQRSAVIAKNVLTQVGTLITLRCTSPQDRAAIEAWVEHNGQKHEILESLAGLENGEAWVWSPEFLRATKRIRFRRSSTFDSGATPKLGAASTKAAATLADVDLGDITKRMAETIERAEANDPKALHARIAELEKQLAAKPKAKPVVFEKPVFRTGEIEAMKAMNAQMQEAVASFTSSVSAGIALQVIAEKKGYGVMAGKVVDLAVANDEWKKQEAKPRINLTRSGIVTKEREDAALDKCERAILRVLAQHPDGCSASKLTLLSVYRWTGSFRDAIGRLRRYELLTGENSGTLRITAAGEAQIAGEVEPLPEGRALVDFWMRHPIMDACMRKIMEALLRSPRGLSAEKLLEETNYKWTGSFRDAIGRLRTAGLLVGKNSDVLIAADDLVRSSRSAS